MVDTLLGILSEYVKQYEYKALLKFRKREYIEESIKNHKAHTGGRRRRVWRTNGKKRRTVSNMKWAGSGIQRRPGLSEREPGMREAQPFWRILRS